MKYIKKWGKLVGKWEDYISLELGAFVQRDWVSGFIMNISYERALE